MKQLALALSKLSLSQYAFRLYLVGYFERCPCQELKRFLDMTSLPWTTQNAGYWCPRHVIDGIGTQVDQWMANEELILSKYAENLPYVDSGRKISSDPKTWVCEDSGKTENLWLNLSTGVIGCPTLNV